MSNELAPLTDPGLPEHVHRKADVDPRAAKKAERQVGILFLLSVVGTLLFIYAYVGIDESIFIFLPVWVLPWRSSSLEWRLYFGQRL
jgi:ubiquinol-cytochrome c reductase iron-sulfur subunit